MPKDLTDWQKVRYIYLHLGMLFTFDENYFYANTKNKNKIYSMAISESNKLNKLKHANLSENIQVSKLTDCINSLNLPRKKAICVYMAKTLSILLNSAGIYSTVIKDDLSDPHMYTEFKIDNIPYSCDMQRDLYYIQTKQPTEFFGECMSDIDNSASDDLLAEIDKSLNYFYDGTVFLNLAKQRFTNAGDQFFPRKFKEIINTACDAPGAKNLEYSERMVLLSTYLDKILFPPEKNNYHKYAFDCKNATNLSDDLKRSLADTSNYLICFSVFGKDSFSLSYSNNEKTSDNSKWRYFIYSDACKHFIDLPGHVFNELCSHSNDKRRINYYESR